MKRAPHALIGLLGVPVAFLIEGALRLSDRRLGLAVAFHAVSDPQGDPKRELVPALGTRLFEAQVQHLKRRYRVVPPSELLSATRERRRRDRFPVAITFDDDLRSHVDVAMPILQRHRLAAAFFVSGASLATPFAFWWERLQLAVDRHGGNLSTLTATSAGYKAIPPGGATDIHELGRRIEAMAPDERDAFAAMLEARLGGDPSDAGLRTEDLRSLAAGGFEMGFHTLRHDPLPSLDDEALARAMTIGRASVEEVVGYELKMIAYPHGRANARVAGVARTAGYECGFTGVPEAVRPTTDPLLVGRLNPSYRTVGHFALQLVRALLTA
jgi:peptidoglycan/xylan/chitin deacetylase (PgdA/CDA1 family)